jgi:hypothetical protein
MAHNASKRSAEPVRAENCVTWAYASQLAVGLVTRLALAGQVPARPRCDDLRLAGLKLIFLSVAISALTDGRPEVPEPLVEDEGQVASLQSRVGYAVTPPAAAAAGGADAANGLDQRGVRTQIRGPLDQRARTGACSR